MRITIVQGPYFPVPPRLASGVEKMWYALGREFARRGHRVVHISRRFADLPTRESAAGVDYVRIPSFDAPKSKLLYRSLDAIYSLRALRSLPVGADIVVTNCMWLPIFIRSGKFGALYVHVARRPKGQMWLYRHAPRIQTVSSVMRDAIAGERGVRPERIRVIPPFVDTLDRGPGPGCAALRRTQSVLYVGRVHPEKGVHLLISAFGRLGPLGWRLVIVGPHESERGGGGSVYRRELALRAAPFASQIDFVGMVDQAELVSHLERSALLAYPSLAERGESFGVVPLEAMACSCPVIVSDLDCFRDYVEPGVNGLVFDHRSADPESALASQLRRLIDDEVLRGGLAARGRQTAERFTFKVIADRYLEDFASLCGSSCSPL